MAAVPFEGSFNRRWQYKANVRGMVKDVSQKWEVLVRRQLALYRQVRLQGKVFGEQKEHPALIELVNST